MEPRNTTFLSLLTALKRGLQETQETKATVSVPPAPELRRTHKRFKFKWVRAELRRPAVPPLPCYLEDLSESGCRLIIEPGEDFDLEAWKADIARARTLEIVFKQVGEAELKVLALLRHVHDGLLGSLVLGIQFCGLSDPQRHE
ncbi:MAG: PilZ domain-containing protein, partial [Planctomycetota bacterium]